MHGGLRLLLGMRFRGGNSVSKACHVTSRAKKVFFYMIAEMASV